nr:hypothetical protein [Micromonospora provocatoris]
MTGAPTHRLASASRRITAVGSGERTPSPPVAEAQVAAATVAASSTGRCGSTRRTAPGQAVT